MAFFFLCFSCFICLVSRLNARPIVANPAIDAGGLARLIQYGYIANNEQGNNNLQTNTLRDKQVISDALKRFQRFANIEETGLYDKATQKMIFSPRCGNPDIISPSVETARRKRRFLAQGSKWLNTTVTWQLETTNNNGISDAIIQRFMQRSLQKWSDAANIDFVQLPRSSPDGSSRIRVRFGTGNHGDPFPFDGPSGTLAHAFFPLNNLGLLVNAKGEVNKTFSTWRLFYNINVYLKQHRFQAVFLLICICVECLLLNVRKGHVRPKLRSVRNFVPAS